jgi:general secretion pathway protein J
MKTGSDAGFTLLELLVAMTLMGLLSVVLFGALRYGVLSWERSETLTTESNQVRQVQQLLTREVGQAYPERVRTDPAHPHIDFEGYAHAIRYLARDSVHRGAMDRVEIEVAPGSDTLRRSESLELSSAQRAASRPLLRGLSAFDVSYFEPGSENRGPSWQNAWQNHTVLPALIKIRARFAAKGSPTWPDLVIAPRISADISCGFDPLTKDCQGR